MDNRKCIVFTDLDGTLLDEEDYSYESARQAIAYLNDRRIPLVFVSSKTKAELVHWRERLANHHPFITENGGGIFIPKGYFRDPGETIAWSEHLMIRLGTQYETVRRHFVEIRDRLKIAARGFGDMSSKEVAELTGLPESEAYLAKQRDFCEPFVFSGKRDDRLLQEIEREGLRWTQGRFFHVMGDHHKGRAVEIVTRLYRQEHGNVQTIGLGDSLNDMPLLLAVDWPVLVRKRTGYDERVTIPGLIRTEGIGPRGWNEAIGSFFEE